MTAEAIDADPWLSFPPDGQGRWVIRDRETRQPLVSPLDHDREAGDISYVGRLAYHGGSLFVIAGVHAMGSLGAVEYLSQHMAPRTGTLRASGCESPFPA